MKPDTDDSIETLIRLAGERERPSAPATGRARAAAEEAWRRMLAQEPPARARFELPLAFAAVLALAVLGFLVWKPREASQPPVQVARVVALGGTATLIENGPRTPVAKDAPVMSGASLVTGQGRAAVSFAEALSLRLDHDTRLRFDAHDRVTLLQGALYVDSGGLGTGPPLTIATPAGEVRHVGTQFQVRVSGDGTSIRVREGRVSLQRGAGEYTRMVAAGDELELRGAEERWRRGLVSYGADWDWAASLAPALAIEDRPLAEFLAWMAREQGWQVHYRDEQAQQRTLDIRLHGSLEGLDAHAMLERVALVTGIPLIAGDGAIWVGGRPR
jgi:ferric-dicitrate binding protein FerR (iron transport regulator)